MILEILAIRDRKIETYTSPIFVPHIGMATRSFGDAVNGNKDSDLAKHPEDFDLYHIGQFDNFSATFSANVGGPRLIATGLDLVTKG